jgi:hypothetical protein
VPGWSWVVVVVAVVVIVVVVAVVVAVVVTSLGKVGGLLQSVRCWILLRSVL